MLGLEMREGSGRSANGLEMRGGSGASGTDGGLEISGGSGARARGEGRKWDRRRARDEEEEVVLAGQTAS